MFQVTFHILCFDLLARHSIPVSDKAKHTRWCLVHALGNAVVSITAIQDVLLVSSNPWAHAMEQSETITPVSMALMLHLYHALFYTMPFDDLMHHMLFALIMGTPSYLYANRVNNMMLFFLSGLPGSVIYLVIVFRRLGYFTLNERCISYYINVYLRTPGILWTCACVLLHGVDGSVPVAILMLQVALSSTNAIYYALQSKARYARS